MKELPGLPLKSELNVTIKHFSKENVQATGVQNSYTVECDNEIVSCSDESQVMDVVLTLMRMHGS